MSASISHDSPLPLYHQLEAVLRERIARGLFRRDVPIPGELELAEEFGVSRGTMRQALDRLVRAGLLERKRGKGSFVASPPVEYALGRSFSFAHAMRERGIEESSRVLAQARGRLPEAVAHAMGLPGGSDAIRIVRLRLAGEQPLLLDTSWVPERAAPSLLGADLSHGSIYDVMQADGTHVTRIVERIRPVLLSARPAAALGVPEGSAAFDVERVVYAAARRERAVEWRSILAPGDRVSLSSEWGAGTDPSAPSSGRIESKATRTIG